MAVPSMPRCAVGAENIEFLRTPPKAERNTELLWTFWTFDNAVKHDPDLCWKLILAVLERDQTDEVQGMAAAGPLEDLLAAHGKNVIAVVEEKWRQDAIFRRALKAVWRNSMSEEVWARVQALNAKG